MTRADLFDEAADDCAALAAMEKANWDEYRPERYTEPAARAIKLREFATRVRAYVEADNTTTDDSEPHQRATRAVLAWLRGDA